MDPSDRKTALAGDGISPMREETDMALIHCPKCGKEVSDRAETCPACGCKLAEYQTENVENRKKRTCPDCGMELEDSVTVCPNCGCPCLITSMNGESCEEGRPENISQDGIEVASPDVNAEECTSAGGQADDSQSDLAQANFSQAEKEEKHHFAGWSHKKLAILIAACTGAAVLILILAVSGMRHMQAIAQEKQYEEALQTAADDIIQSGNDAEYAADLIYSVWYNCIYEEDDILTDRYTKDSYGYFYDDFNDALASLMYDDDFEKKTSQLETDRKKIQREMKALKNSPKEYREACTSVKALYNAYLDLQDCATDPTGSLSTYSNEVNSAESKFSRCSKDVEMYVDIESNDENSASEPGI